MNEKDREIGRNAGLHARHGKGVKWMDFQQWWHQHPGSDFMDYLAYRKKQPKSEKALEEHFTRKVKEAGGWAVKFNSMGTAGMPDRIVFYRGLTWLVELKTLTGVLSPVQKVIHKKFEGCGHQVRTIRHTEEITAFISDMKNLIG